LRWQSRSFRQQEDFVVRLHSHNCGEQGQNSAMRGMGAPYLTLARKSIGAPPIDWEPAPISILPSAAHAFSIDATSRSTRQETAMIRTTMTALTFAILASLGASSAQANDSNNRLMIVNGNSGHVIYDDGRDDLFCVTRRYVTGYDYNGRRIVRRSMRCR
jgi:hypothetical protein